MAVREGNPPSSGRLRAVAQLMFGLPDERASTARDAATQDEIGAFGVLIFDPTAGASKLADMLRTAGIRVAVRARIAEVCVMLRAGLGVLIGAANSLGRGAAGEIAHALAEAPPWSDLPVIVLTGADGDETACARIARELGERACVTFLSWPGPDWSLTTSVRAALRVRKQQYECRERELQEQGVRASEQKFRLMAEASRVMIGIVQDRRFLYVNPFLVDCSGYTREELLSMDVGKLVHPDYRDLVLDRARRRQAGEAMPASYEYVMLTKSGQPRWVEIAPVQIDYLGAPAVIGTAIDITERKAALEGLRLLSDTATRLLVAEDPRIALRCILDGVAAHLDADVYLCYLVTEDRQRLRLHCSRGLDDEALRGIETVEFGQTACATVAQTGERIVISNVQQDRGPKAALLQSLGLRAYACYPLLSDEVLGTISLATRKRAQFTPEELGVVQAVADQAVMALIRERLNAELKQRARDLEAADKAKDHFLAVLSHELRTPLTPVLASSSALAVDPRILPDVRERLEMIRRNTEMEARLIDDLLDITRIARGQVELDRRTVQLRVIIEHALEVCRSQIEERRLQLAVDLRETRLVCGDPARLEQVFWNLLNNATKFTPPGGSLTVRCRALGTHVLAEVADTGMGIEPHALQRIFNAFEQADQSRRGHFGGLGLGLAISKALVELHGGRISAHSEGEGCGATFTVRLPVAAKPAIGARGPVSGVAPPAPVSATSSSMVERGLRILLVEDHADTAKVIAWLLQAAGHTVETAGDVRTALERIGQQSFDLLISDLGLPDGSGVDLMRELRRRGHQLPGIALTGYAQQEDLQRTRQAGFSRHLTKPIEAEQLERAIAQQFAVAR